MKYISVLGTNLRLKIKFIKKALLIASVGLFILVVLFSRQSEKLLLNDKFYSCSPLTKEDRNNLKVLSSLLNDLKNIKENSIKRWEEKLNQCGTEKEFEVSQGLKEMFPESASFLEQYGKSKPYTIKDFQSCKTFWENAKRQTEKEQNAGIENQEKQIEKILSKNNCKIIQE